MTAQDRTSTADSRKPDQQPDRDPQIPAGTLSGPGEAPVTAEDLVQHAHASADELHAITLETKRRLAASRELLERTKSQVKLDPSSQAQKFADSARELECNPSEEESDDRLKPLAKADASSETLSRKR